MSYSLLAMTDKLHVTNLGDIDYSLAADIWQFFASFEGIKWVDLVDESHEHTYLHAGNYLGVSK